MTTAVAQQRVQEAKELLSHLVRRVPPSLREVKKQIFIGNEIVDKLSPEQQAVLVNVFHLLLRQMIHYGASDLEFGGPGTGGRVWLRVNGLKRPLNKFEPFNLDEANILIQSILMQFQRFHLYDNLSLDFSYVLDRGEPKSTRFRATVYFEMGELALNARIIHQEVRSYKTYNFPQQVTRICSLRYTKDGLILVTGITGSGKSTTLDAIIDMNNRTAEGHIVIIASPVEYVHQSLRCLVRHREVGLDTHSFKSGTIEALRQDPDIIVIGEMRDPDTILAALEAADTGHKVFSTLHTSSAVESIDRIIGEVSPEEQDRVRNRLADILRCVISQKLVPSRKGNLVLAKEILVMTPSVRAAIKNNNTSEIYQMIAEGENEGMVTLEQDLRRLYLQGIITVENAINYANNKRRMVQLLRMK